MKKSKGVFVIVPFYNNPHLVESLTQGLLACIGELRALNCEFIFINDSPDNLYLEKELSINIDILNLAGFTGKLINNAENLGFIKSTNKGLLLCIKNYYDAILLNSDAVLYPGCISEMHAVAYIDEMIGFVSPRSNEAGLSTIPHLASSAKRYLTKDDGLKLHSIMKAWLPRFTFTPTAVGFCLFIKNKIIREFGVLDEIYGKGYNEENDLILRANRFGYRSALANYAYCWHEGSVSFGKGNYTGHDESNRKILDARYPEYSNMLHSYYASPSYKSENILSGFLVGSTEDVQHIALNLSNIGPNYNGTAEMASNISRELSENKNLRLHFITDEATAKFHNFGRYGLIDSPSSDRRYAAIVHIGQPFKWRDVFFAIHHAPINAYFMLDTIAQDCGYLHSAEVDKIWGFIAKNSDAIFYISEYSK
jgi:GT2 family glycosyltransferase